jgi:hypothetical protein
MADPAAEPAAPVSESAGTQSVLTQAQLAAIAAAVAAGVEAGVSSGVSQALTQASQQIAKQVAESITGATDSDSGYLVRSSIDPAVGQRNTDAYREMAVADCVAFRKACDALILRKISVDTDHHQPHPASSPANAA